MSCYMSVTFFCSLLTLKMYCCSSDNVLSSLNAPGLTLTTTRPTLPFLIKN